MTFRFATLWMFCCFAGLATVVSAQARPAQMPMPAGYGPLTALQPPGDRGYYVPAAAPRGATSYWAEIQPAAGYAPPASPAPRGYFPPPMYLPPTAVFPHPNYVPVSHAGSEFGVANPYAPHIQPPSGPPEGSVLSQSAQPMYGERLVAPYGGSSVASGGALQAGPATPGMYGAIPGMYGATSGMYGAVPGAVPGVYGATSGMHGVVNDSASGYGCANAGIACAPVGGASPWFFGFGGLAMTRDDENNYLFSYDDANESVQLTNARNANFDWAGGFEVSFGRTFNCGRNAVQAVYWGLFPTDGVTTTTSGDTVGNLNGILNWDQLDYGLDPVLYTPWTADEFTNNSTAHMVRRQNEIHNVEVNLLTFLTGGYWGAGGGCGGACGGGGCGYGVGASRWSHDWLVGLRIFRFRDHLLFGAERAGGNGIFRHEDDEIYYNIDITNNLVGAQLGCSGAYAMSCRCALDYGVKFGLFGNQISHTSEIGGSQGMATINNGPNAGIDFFVENTKSAAAFLGEANLGVSWRFGNCCSASIGYRAVAVTGVALPTNQIYHDLRGIQDVRWIDSNGSLILHGGYLRAEYRF